MVKERGMTLVGTRTKKAATNLAFVVPSQVIICILDFYLKRKFASALGVMSMGIESTFSNLLTLFSLSGLGILPALSYNLYKPFAENDTERLKIVVDFIKKVCWGLAAFFLLIGGLFVFRLEWVATNIYDIKNMKIIYLLFLINAVLPCFFAHRHSMILYNQKKYIVVIINFIAVSLSAVAKLFILNTNPNLVSFMACTVLATLLEGVIVFFVSCRKYPFLATKSDACISKREALVSFKNVGGAVLNHVFGLVVNFTNNIYMSKFVGLAVAGIYSPYQAILSEVKLFNSHFCEAIGPSVGNLAALGEYKKLEKRFYSVLLIGNWIFSMAACVLASNLTPFINVWMPGNTTFDDTTCMFILINFYMLAIRKLVLMFKNNMGIYWDGRYVTFCEAVLDVILGYLFSGHGAIGIFAGLTISVICTCFWWEPWLLFKLGFKSSVVVYFKKQLLYYGASVSCCVISVLFCSQITAPGWARVRVGCIISMIVQIFVFWIAFRKTEEFLSLRQLVFEFFRFHVFKLFKLKNRR
ncbi:MAG: hypothetical protein LBJ38_01455 [Oscillospiraceae bacterium]|jgi:O-antigen/teichoic acid export membrane protein|nr:hypothetical protein [Oscillospiraceae bacterium]